MTAGSGLARIRALLAEAFAASPMIFEDATFYDTLQRLDLPPQVLFSQAMALHLTPT